VLRVAVSVLHTLKYLLLTSRFEEALGRLLSMKEGLEAEDEAINVGKLLLWRSRNLDVPAHIFEQLQGKQNSLTAG